MSEFVIKMSEFITKIIGFKFIKCSINAKKKISKLKVK